MLSAIRLPGSRASIFLFSLKDLGFVLVSGGHQRKGKAQIQVLAIVGLFPTAGIQTKSGGTRTGSGLRGRSDGTPHCLQLHLLGGFI